MHKQTQKESKEERAAVATLSGSHSFRSEGNFFLRAARCHDDRRHYQLQSRDRCPSKKKKSLQLAAFAFQLQMASDQYANEGGFFSI